MLLSHTTVSCVTLLCPVSCYCVLCDATVSCVTLLFTLRATVRDSRRETAPAHFHSATPLTHGGAIVRWKD